MGGRTELLSCSRVLIKVGRDMKGRVGMSSVGHAEGTGMGGRATLFSSGRVHIGYRRPWTWTGGWTLLSCKVR